MQQPPQQGPIDVLTFDGEIKTAFGRVAKDVSVDWAVFGFNDAQMSVLRPLRIGTGGIGALRGHLGTDRLLYLLCRMAEPTSRKLRLVFGIWLGENAPASYSGVLSRQLPYLRLMFKVVLRTEADLDVNMVWRKIQQSPQLQRYAQASSAPSQDMVNPINALMLQQQLLAQQQKIALQTANSPALGAVHQNAETSAAAEKTSPTSVASDLVFPLSRDQFDTLYAQFQLETGIHIGRVPVFASKPLDLYGLFASCIALTGIKKVLERKLWKHVLTLMQLPTNISSASSMLKKHYRSFLEQFEKWYTQHQHTFLQQGKILSLMPSNVDEVLHVITGGKEEFASVSSSGPPTPATVETLDDASIVEVDQLDPASRPSMSEADNGHLVIGEVKQEEGAAHDSTDTINGHAAANAPDSPEKSIQHQQKTVNENSKYHNKLLRQVESFAGYDIDRMQAAVRGPGEAGTKRPRYGKMDLGGVDLYRVLMMLRSGAFMDQSEALKILLILSYDAPTDIALSHVGLIVNELIKLWARCLLEVVDAPESALNNYQETLKNGQLMDSLLSPEPSYFWTYSALFQLERRLVEDLMAGESCGGCHLIPNTMSLNACFGRKVRAAELGVLISTVWRNWSATAQNQMYLSGHQDFVRLLFYWMRLQPVSIPAAIVDADKERVGDSDCKWIPADDMAILSIPINASDLHNTFLQQRKSMLCILQNLSLVLKWPDNTAAQWVIRVLADFIEPSPQEAFGIRSVLQVNAYMSSPDGSLGPYVFEAIEALCKATALIPNCQRIASMLDSEGTEEQQHATPIRNLVIRLWNSLAGNLPLGISNRSAPGEKKENMCDLVVVLAALQTMSQFTIFTDLLLDFSRFPYLLHILTRITNGYTWVHCSYRISDPNWQETFVANPTRGDEKDNVSQLVLKIAIRAGEILADLLRDRQARKIMIAAVGDNEQTRHDIRTRRMGYGVCVSPLHDTTSFPGYRCSTVLHVCEETGQVLHSTPFPSTTPTTTSTNSNLIWNSGCGLLEWCHEVEYNILGPLMNTRLPEDLSRVLTDILYYLSLKDQDENEGEESEGADVDRSGDGGVENGSKQEQIERGEHVMQDDQPDK